jgi:type III secretion protein Q
MTVGINTMLNGGLVGTAGVDLFGEVRAAPEPESALAPAVISLAEAASINAFYCRRPALVFPVAGHTAILMASWPPPLDHGSGKYRIHLTIDGAAGALIVSDSLVKALIAELDPDQGLEKLGPQQRALLFELAVADGLSALEASLGSRLSIESVFAAGNEESSAASLALDIAIDGVASVAELRLLPRHAVRFAQCLDRSAALRPADGPEQASIGLLPVVFSVRVAATVCSVAEIATLRPGDIVMADHGGRHPPTAVAVLAEHLAAPVELTAAGVQLAAAPVRIRGSMWEWSMENGAERPQTEFMETTDLDDIPVRLLFELGRVELSLAEIRKLAPGALIAMPRPVDDSVDIVANGRRIGRGSLVQIGSNLGVRITRLLQDV